MLALLNRHNRVLNHHRADSGSTILQSVPIYREIWFDYDIETFRHFGAHRARPSKFTCKAHFSTLVAL